MRGKERPPQTHEHDCLQLELNSQPSDPLPGQSPAQPQTPVTLSSQTVIPSSQEGEYDDQLWADEFYNTVDWDNLELTLLKSQEVTN